MLNNGFCGAKIGAIQESGHRILDSWEDGRPISATVFCPEISHILLDASICSSSLRKISIPCSVRVGINKLELHHAVL
jgi:hypothetical protein